MYFKVLISAFLISLTAIEVKAQDFEVAPVMINFQVEPGNAETRRVSITNHGDKSQVFNLKLSDYKVDDEGKVVKGEEVEETRSLKDILNFSPAFLELPPNGQGYIDFILNVPVGDYTSKWGVVAVVATQERTAAEVDKQLATGILISPRIAIYVNQSPRSNKNMAARILEFSEATASNAVKRTFNVQVKNVGDKLIKGDLKLLLANINTGEEQELEIKEVNIYPGSKKTVEFIIDRPKSGKYALAAVLDYGSESDLEGMQIIIEEK